MIAIVIPTFTRPDGQTPFYLESTLISIDRQTFRDYRVYVVGDAYENMTELMEITNRHKQVSCINLPFSPERTKYGLGNINIWHVGGLTATNTGVEMALKDGIDYVCHLAHDDFWESNHLELINKVIIERQPIFICTLSTYVGKVFPKMAQTNAVIPFYPIESGLIASAVCIKYTDTQLRLVDRFATEGISYPCDAYLWMQLRDEMKRERKIGYLICTLTCHHDEEGYASGGAINGN
jgi:glycosyltransferase involved in cell wall biosynthesis